MSLRFTAPGSILGLVLWALVCGSCNTETRGVGGSDGSSLLRDSGSQPACGPGSHDVSCSCSNVGETVSCCAGGTQRCTQVGEFAAWGPCHTPDKGVVDCSAPCANGEFGGCDAGVPVDMAQSSCSCVPGAVRWCDEPNFCTWGKQTCAPDGKWGQCIEAGVRPTGCDDLFNLFYDQDCCVNAGHCCQDVANQTGIMSLGNCPGIVVCE